VQQRQMTTSSATNVHAIAIEGNFDDCQALLKDMFNDHGFRDRVSLSGVNSINWARIMAQIVYYFSSALSLGAPDRPVSFTVPTGNFGDIFAGYAAKQMGLPVERLVIATNDNDILARAIASGVYETLGVVATTSPSMDIQVSSNFERLLFEAYGRDAAAVRSLMRALETERAFTIADAPLARIRADFDAQAVDEAAGADEIGATWREAGYLIDPHTAIGVRASRALLARRPDTPVVALATAHPAKFPEAVAAATGHRPALPAHLADLMDRPERFTVIPNDRAAVERFIRERARAARGAAA
jgi:threonine synthase